MIPTALCSRRRTAWSMRRPRIAGYEILEVLGAGGMGIVYKAHQQRLDRFVALKMIRAGAGARPEDLVRFETEAKAVAAIEHANIVKIFEIGEQDGLPYFSLEFLAGGSLAKKIGGKPQPVDEAARIVEVLARAIARGARAQGDPPRPQTGQCPPRRRWHAQDHRLRAGEAAGERLGTNPQRLDPGHAELHGSRTGAGREPDGRAGRRPVCPGRDPLRAAHRPPALPGNVGPRYPRHGPEQGAGSPVSAPAQDAPRPGDDLSEVPAKKTSHAVIPTSLPWPKTCGRFRAGETDPGASGFRRRAALAVVPAQPQGRAP